MSPVAAGTGDTQTGDIIDTFGWESIAFGVSFGALTAGAVTGLKVQYGNQANGSDMADVAGSPISIPQATGSNQVWWSAEIYRPTKRYLRVAVVRATANAVINAAMVMMFRSLIGPPTQGPNAGNGGGGPAGPPILISP
jgi:hypothetical protein